MNKATLIRKMETAIDDAVSLRMYGTIEIEFRAGEPIFIRTMKAEKLDNEMENHYGQQKPQNRT